MKKVNVSEGDSSKGCRDLGVEILLKVEKNNAYADLLLDSYLRKFPLSLRDRALLTQLVFGTLRWRGNIDWHLSRFLRRPLPSMSSYLRNLLRLTLYQLCFLDRVPDYAAVNEGVELAKRHGGSKAGGLVNAVMRKILREGDKLTDSYPRDDPVGGLSIRWSHPRWLVARWLVQFGREETEALLMANNEEPHITLRVNGLKNDRERLLERLKGEGFEAAPTPWSPHGIRLKASSAVDQLPGFQQGLFQVQGEASQLAGFLLAPQPGERVLDACAAPGGKTTHLAELMEDRGEIIAVDISARGLEKLNQNVQRLRLMSLHIFQTDVTKALKGPLAEPYDRILIDAPCSALGTLRSHPEAKWQRTESDIQRLSKLQRKIVHQVSSYLKPGGVLLYATCTLAREENEQVVEDFLDAHTDFVMEGATDHLPREARQLTRGDYFLALPHKHDTDGFFAARMRKTA